MEIWTHLGIEKTKDIDAINEAYHNKLPLVNPEDKPEEFMALRSEYEEALRYAKEQPEEQKPESELTPVELWTHRLDAVYTRIADRCDAGKWNELLSDPIFDSLDSRADAQEALLDYLMEHWHLPRDIWQLLDRKFDLCERKKELVEKFPKDFIENAVIDGVNCDPSLPYELFLPQNTGDVDPFFQLYFKARDELYANDLDNAKSTLDDLDATGIVHPFGDVLHIRYDYLRSEGNEASDDVLARAKALYETYPDYTEISGFYADMLSTRGDNAEAIEIYDKILEAEPGNNNIRYHKSQALMELGNFKDAKKILGQLQMDIPFNDSIRSRFAAANQKLMEQYAETVAHNPGDMESRIEYAWCLFQNNEDAKAREIIEGHVPEELPLLCDYENIMTKLSQNSEDFEGTLRHAALWRDAVQRLPEGQTEEEKYRKDKIGDIAFLESAALLSLKRYDEAVEKSNEATAADPTEFRAYSVRYYAYHHLHDYENALKTCEEMVQNKPMAYSYYCLGCAHYTLGNMQEAFNSFGTANEYDKEANNYVYRARILILYDQYDEAQEIIDLLKESNIRSEGVKYCESLILHEKEEKEEEAKALWQEIIDADKAGNCDCAFLCEVYNCMVVYMINHDAAPEEILAMADRGLAARDDYAPLLMNKGYILDEKLDKHEEGLAIYRTVYETSPRHSSVCGKMGAIYYYDLYDIPTALDFFRKQEGRSDSAFCQVMLGNCYSCLENYGESDIHFRAAMELSPESERILRDYITMLLRCGKTKEALKVSDKLCETVGDRSPYARRKKAQILARMGRYAKGAEIHLKLYEQFGKTEDIESAADMYIDGGFADNFLSVLKKYKEELGDTYYWNMIRYSMAIGDDRNWMKAVRSISKDNKELPRHYAIYHFWHNDYKKALHFADEYFNANPDSIMQRHTQIICRRKLGMTDGLDKLFERAMEILSADKDPGYKALFLTKKALLYVSMEMYDEAKKCIDEAFASPLCSHCAYGGCIDAYDALAAYCTATGDYNGAARACLDGMKLAPLDCDFGTKLRRLRKEHKKELDKELQK